MNEIINSKKCNGCFACFNICPKNVITMVYDKDKFKYSIVNNDKCIKCGLCEKVCPINKKSLFNRDIQKAFGGFNKNTDILKKSTSGGAFSAIVEAFCDDNYVIFANSNKGLDIINKIDKYFYYRELDIKDAIRYQAPLRGHIKDNPDKKSFMDDLHKLPYEELIKKWYTKMSLKLLYSKYVWGNRQKMFIYNL